MEKIKEFLIKLENYPKETIYNHEYYQLCIDLIDYFWKIRKEYPYGDKIIGIMCYHDFISCAVNARMNCYYIEGKYDHLKDKTHIFPDWDKFIEENKNNVKEYYDELQKGLESFNKFIELGYLPYFYGWYRKQYLKFTLNKELGDYIVDLNSCKILTTPNKISSFE